MQLVLKQSKRWKNHILVSQDTDLLTATTQSSPGGLRLMEESISEWWKTTSTWQLKTALIISRWKPARSLRSPSNSHPRVQPEWCWEKAAHRSKVAIFEADKLFREEVDLKAEKARKETIRRMRCGMNMTSQRRAHRQQMKASEVPIKALRPPVHFRNHLSGKGYNQRDAILANERKSVKNSTQRHVEFLTSCSCAVRADNEIKCHTAKSLSEQSEVHWPLQCIPGWVSWLRLCRTPRGWHLLSTSWW